RPVVSLLDATCSLESVNETVEANARPEQGRKVEGGSHSHILLEATWVQDCSVFNRRRPRLAAAYDRSGFGHFCFQEAGDEKFWSGFSLLEFESHSTI